ncbi:MAG TPA: phosphopyruvate hydratase [Chitinophagaceae bacterium]
MNNNADTRIRDIIGREVFDSRGNPTVEVDVILESGIMGRMIVPSGASTGKYEAIELRDGGKRYHGKGVLNAVGHVNNAIKKVLKGVDARDQERIDELMITLDGTDNKSGVGANAILGVSLAVAHAAAIASDKQLYQYLADKYLPGHTELALPVPMVNIISGGAHAGKKIDVQDFLVVPLSATSYPEALEMIFAVYRKTQEVLLKKGHNAFLLADEGGFGPHLSSNKEALDILCDVFEQCGYVGGKDIAIALDIASSGFYDTEKKQYHLAADNCSLSSLEMITMLEQWVAAYPVISIEDGLAEEDWEGWQQLTLRLGNKIQLVGDDLFTTHPVRIQKGIDLRAGNTVLIKMNQIGTLTETVNAINLAKKNGYKTVISARSGETEDTTLADLAVGLQGGQIKIGSVAGSSRLAKYNQLLRIHEQTGGKYERPATLFKLTK